MLSCGLKFCLIPKHVKKEIVLLNFEKFSRRLRLKKQFINTTNNNEILRVANSKFNPSISSNCLEAYITNRFKDINDALSTTIPPGINFNNCVRNILSELKKDKSIIICNADKNLGVVIMDRLLYEKEVLNHLSDYTSYKLIPLPPDKNELFQKLRSILEKHRVLTINDDGKLSPLALYMLQLQNEKLQLSKFYLTMKIHKNPVVGRPICSSLGTITHYTSKLLDYWLQPIASKTNLYVKNSFDFMLELGGCVYPTDCVILTCDVVSLYPSIILDDGLLQLKRALIIYDVPPHLIDLIVDLCQWVLNNNFIEFGDTLWHQIKGTAMGTPIAVCFSIIYLAMLELDIMTVCESNTNYVAPLIIKRFIDDIGSVFTDKASALIFVNAYQAIRPNSIVITYELSMDRGVFLDLEFYKGYNMIYGKLDTKVYQKPKNQYLYIPPFSFHHPAVFKSTVVSELKRYRILSSNDIDFQIIKTLYYDRLRCRGYEERWLLDLFNIQLDRNSLIKSQIAKRASKNHNNKSSPLIISLPISLRSMALNLTNILSNTINDAWFDPDFHYIFGYPPRVITCYTRATNIGDILHSSKYKYNVTQLGITG